MLLRLLLLALGPRPQALELRENKEIKARLRELVGQLTGEGYRQYSTVQYSTWVEGGGWRE